MGNITCQWHAEHIRAAQMEVTRVGDEYTCRWKGDIPPECQGVVLATLQVARFNRCHLVRREVYACADHVDDLQKMWLDFGATVAVVPGLPRDVWSEVRHPFAKGGAVRKQMLEASTQASGTWCNICDLARAVCACGSRVATMNRAELEQHKRVIGMDPGNPGVILTRSARRRAMYKPPYPRGGWDTPLTPPVDPEADTKPEGFPTGELRIQSGGYDHTNPRDPDYVRLERRHPAFEKVCVVVSFDIEAKPVGVSYQEHLQEFSYLVQRIRNTVWDHMATIPDALVVHPTLMYLVENLRDYRDTHHTPMASSPTGHPYRVGELRGQMSVWVDQSIPHDTGYVARKADRPFIPMGGIEVRNNL